MWILEKRGIIDAEEDAAKPENKPAPRPAPVPEMLAASSRDATPEGGIRREINNTVNNAGNRETTTNIGEQHIHVEQKLSREEMSEYLLMGA